MIEPPPGPTLEVRGLTVRHGRFVALTDIDLPPFAPGSVVAVLGPNGAGKSSLLRALAGQLAYEGSARLGGREIASLDHDCRRALLAYAPQTPPQPSALLACEFALSALRAVMPELDHGRAVQRVEQVFERFGLTPDALRPVRALSGGKRQLLGLTHVFARDAALVLLDEPTSALDLRWEIESLGAVREKAARHGALCLVALHDVHLALRCCDYTVLIDGGRVAAAGAADETLTPRLLRDVYGVEARIERCSRGGPLVLADRVASAPSGHRPERLPC